MYIDADEAVSTLPFIMGYRKTEITTTKHGGGGPKPNTKPEDTSTPHRAAHHDQPGGRASLADPPQ